jgi:SAM-dependent methyltransferase
MGHHEERGWFDDAFQEAYLAVYAHRDDAQAAAEAAVLRPFLPSSGRLLDLGCGHGRHLRALASSGLERIGLDRSAALLRAGRGGGWMSVRGDMRHLPFADGAFAAVLQLFTSFGYFAREEEDRQVLLEVSRVLAPEGVHVLDVPNRDRLVRDLVPGTHRRAGAYEVLERRRLDGAILRKQVRLRHEDTGEERCYEECVRLYDRARLEDELAASGLRVMARLGGFAGEPAESGPRWILISRKGS